MSGLVAISTWVLSAGQLLGTFLRLTDQLGEDFFASDLESFLVEHGLIQSKDDIPSIIRSVTMVQSYNGTMVHIFTVTISGGPL